jgi:hypothetical protein
MPHRLPLGAWTKVQWTESRKPGSLGSPRRGESVPRSGALRISQLAKQTGLSLIEVLVAGLVMGTAIVGMSLMYGTGSSRVTSTGDDRVASGLAQQRIEKIRALGWGCVTTRPPATPPCEIGIPMPEVAVYPAGAVNPGVRSFTRDTCIQPVDPDDPEGLNTPDYTSACLVDPAVLTKQIKMVRITVTVTPIGTGTSNQALGQPNPVTLQAWLAP